MDARVKPAHDGLGKPHALGRTSGTPTPAGRYRRSIFWRTRVMKSAAAIFTLAALALISTSPADAKGCLKGAVVGGVAGHYAGHHGVLGAAAGCLYGRHRAKEQERQQQGQAPAPVGQEKL
jgi:hypothetical protein